MFPFLISALTLCAQLNFEPIKYSISRTFRRMRVKPLNWQHPWQYFQEVWARSLWCATFFAKLRPVKHLLLNT